MNKWESQAGEIHVSPNTTELNVKAVFSPPLGLIIKGKTVLMPQNEVMIHETRADEMLPLICCDENLCYTTKTVIPSDGLQGKCEFQYSLCSLKPKVFIFAGHGFANAIALKGYFDVNTRSLTIPDPQHDYLIFINEIMDCVGGGSFDLLLMLACNVGLNSSLWLDAFNAKSMVASIGLQYLLPLKKFDKYFWDVAIASNISLIEAVDIARGNAEVWLFSNGYDYDGYYEMCLRRLDVFGYKNYNLYDIFIN